MNQGKKAQTLDMSKYIPTYIPWLFVYYITRQFFFSFYYIVEIIDVWLEPSFYTFLEQSL